jgi:hypothetical protein
MTTMTEQNALRALRDAAEKMTSYCEDFYANAKLRGAEDAHPRAAEMAELGAVTLAATATIQPVAAPEPVELQGVAAELKEGSGFWSTCSGCHESEDGHDDGPYPYSNVLKCKLGMGCRECGGIGAVWDNADYGAMAADFMTADTESHAAAAPAQATPDEVRDAARWRAFLGSARIRPLGSAGLNKPEPNHYAHMGLEIWTRFGRSYSPALLEELDRDNERGREWLTKYADIAIKAQKDTAACAATPADSQKGGGE